MSAKAASAVSREGPFEMRNLSDTINRLAGYRVARGAAANDAGAGHLSDLTNFGSNPGSLRARTYVPADLPAKNGEKAFAESAGENPGPLSIT